MPSPYRLQRRALSRWSMRLDVSLEPATGVEYVRAVGQFRSGGSRVGRARRSGGDLLWLVNIGVLVLAWRAFAWWLSTFTELGGLTDSVGAITLVPPTVSALLVPERVKQGHRIHARLLRLLDRHVLQSRATMVVTLAALVVFFGAVAPLFGAIEIEIQPRSEQRDASPRSLRVTASNGEESTSEDSGGDSSIDLNKTRRVCVLASWLSGHDYNVEVSGLPSARVTVDSYRVTHLSLPDSFENRPVVLVYPERNIGGALQAHRPLHLWVEASPNGPKVWEHEEKDYGGEIVVIGASAALSLPPHVTEEWLNAHPDSAVLPPKAVVSVLDAAVPQGEVVAQLLDDEGGVAYEARQSVPKSVAPGQGLLEVVLR